MLMIIVVICAALGETCMNSEDHVKIPSDDRQYILEMLVSEGMPSIDASNAIVELENFYTAIKLGSEGSPSGAVDKAWHAHILNTPMYFDFTDKVFGKYIHHAPYWSGNKEQESSNAYFDLIELGVKILNATIWFGESVEHSTLDPMVPFPLLRSKCRCKRS
jgi:hypothetical protein